MTSVIVQKNCRKINSGLRIENPMIGITVALHAFVLAVGATLLNQFINWGLVYLVGRLSPGKRKD